jgi:5-methylthioribose kinase
MKELRDKDVRNKYIPDKCRELLGVEVDVKKIEFIDEGVMNFVYKVPTSKGIFYFKQALKIAKDHERIGSDLASIPYLRIMYEKTYMDKIKAFLPEDIKIPEIVYCDKENNILVMTDVAGDGRLLQYVLLDGIFDAKAASCIGKYLGIATKCTYNKNNIIRSSREDDLEEWKVKLNMRTKGITEGMNSQQISVEVCNELGVIFEDALKNYTYDVAVNLSCSPKNIFQRQDGTIGVIDFEMASGVGDPAFDMGFVLGHYFIFSILSGVTDESVESFNHMINSHLKEIELLAFEGFMKRMIKYAGAIPLYRSVGSSPAKFIPKEKYKEMISKGSEIIMSNSTEMTEVVRILKKQ